MLTVLTGPEEMCVSNFQQNVDGFKSQGLLFLYQAE